jgi:hypothetical protein
MGFSKGIRMFMRLPLTVGCLIILVVPYLIGENWPHWRGPAKDGVSGEGGLPVTWGAKCADTAQSATTAAQAAAQTGRGVGRRGGFFEGRPLTPLACTDFTESNISWKLRLPAYSGSTPIIWGDIIFLNVATSS